MAHDAKQCSQVLFINLKSYPLLVFGIKKHLPFFRIESRGAQYWALSLFFDIKTIGYGNSWTSKAQNFCRCFFRRHTAFILWYLAPYLLLVDYKFIWKCIMIGFRANIMTMDFFPPLYTTINYPIFNYLINILAFWLHIYKLHTNSFGTAAIASDFSPWYTVLLLGISLRFQLSVSYR